MSLVHPAPGPLPDITRDLAAGDKPRLTAILRVMRSGVAKDCLPAPGPGACSPSRDSFSALSGLIGSLLARIRLAPTLDQRRAVALGKAPFLVPVLPGYPWDYYCISNKGDSAAPLRAASVLRSGLCGRGCRGCQSRKARAGCLNPGASAVLVIPLECHQNLEHEQSLGW